MTDDSTKNITGEATAISDHPSGFNSTPAYSNYVLGVLFIVYVFNFIDRQVLAVFIGPIQEEFGASDTAMGLLVGFAFAVLYTFAGIPIARWADSGNRRNIIALGLTVWSAMTVATGMAKSFLHLVVARIGVGLGEAAGTPPAHSLIADYFPVSKRSTALAIYSSGVFVGAAIAYLGGGYLREYFDWRTTFFVVGIPGLLFALVVRLTVREPPRGHSEVRQMDESTVTLKATFRFLAGSPAWNYLMVGASLLAITGYGVLMWGYEFYGRIHGMSPVVVGQWMALIVGVGGCTGTLLGGRIADWLNRTRADLALKVPAVITLLGMPLGVVFLLTDSKLLSLCCFFPFYLMLDVYIPTMYSVNQGLAKLKMRATASAILLFIINIIGAGAGPFIVGALSDYFAGTYGDDSIRYALVSVLIAGALGCVCLIRSSQFLERDLRRVV